MTLNAVFKYVDTQNVKIVSFSSLCARLWGTPSRISGHQRIHINGGNSVHYLQEESYETKWLNRENSEFVRRDESFKSWSLSSLGYKRKISCVRERHVQRQGSQTCLLHTPDKNSARKPGKANVCCQITIVVTSAGRKDHEGLLGAAMCCSLIWLPVTQVCSVKKWATGTIYKYVHFSVCVSQFNKEVKGFLKWQAGALEGSCQTQDLVVAVSSTANHFTSLSLFQLPIWGKKLALPSS